VNIPWPQHEALTLNLSGVIDLQGNAVPLVPGVEVQFLLKLRDYDPDTEALAHYSTATTGVTLSEGRATITIPAALLGAQQAGKRYGWEWRITALDGRAGSPRRGTLYLTPSSFSNP
jgi:hypothetical protein